MTTTELYTAFLAGREIPTLTQSAARSLLDYCRNVLLTVGKKLRPAGTTTEIKARLLEAHEALTGGPQVYAHADNQPHEVLGGHSFEEAEAILAQLKKHNASNKNRRPSVTNHKPTTTPTNQPTMSPPIKPAPAATAIAKPATPSPYAAMAKAVVDEQEARAAAAAVKTRAQLDAMKPAAIAKFFRDGGKLTD